MVTKLYCVLRTYTILHLCFFKCITHGIMCTMCNIFIMYTRMYTIIHCVHAYLCRMNETFRLLGVFSNAVSHI